MYIIRKHRHSESMARLFTCEFDVPSEGKFQMAMTTAATGDHPVGVLPPFETALLQCLTSLSETWQPMDVLVLSQTHSIALHCCVQTGLGSCRSPRVRGPAKYTGRSA